MILSLIVAMDKNGVIGVNGRLPWHLPDDMKWFREQTIGKPVIMGRKTFESIPEKFRPLPGRHNIIHTRNVKFHAEGATIVHSLGEALAAAGNVAEVMIIGGAELYAQFLPQADRIYLTQIDAAFEGDASFPEITPSAWRERWRQVHEPDKNHPYRFSWVILERV
jgi:dihydrofolate reductase